MNSEPSRRIVLLDAGTLGPDATLDPIARLGELIRYDATAPAQTGERIGTATVVIANKVTLDRQALEPATDALRLIALTATGTNNVDLAFCRERGIAVTNVAGYSTESVAQHTLAFVLQLIGRLPYYQRYVASGHYHDSPIFTHYGPAWHELSGKRWGIIGLGAIGRRVAELARAFGCEVVYYSTSGSNTDQPYEHLPLDELLSTSAVVTVHAPLTDATRGCIGRREIGLLAGDAVIVNMGRGGIIDEEALADAIAAGLIGGAATDVFSNEPLHRDSPLASVLSNNRFIATPHSAWLSVEARRRLIDEVAENVAAFFRGARRNRVD